MNRYIALLFIVIALSLGCGSSSDNSNASSTNSTTPRPTTTPTPTDEETAAKVKNESEQQRKAIQEYLEKNQKGWTLSGVSGSLDEVTCSPDTPCYLHLTQKGKSKVVPVMMRKFESENGNSYWLVYEAKGFDLISFKIEEMKESAADEARQDEHENTLANLTIEDCQPLLDEMAEDARDARDDDGPY